MNKIKTDIIISSGIAFIFTLLDIMHKKIGGMASAGRYSEAHSWGELVKLAPNFIITFIVFFAGIFLFRSLRKK